MPRQKLGVGTQVPKVQRTCCTPRWHCEGRFRIIRCIHQARSVNITNESNWRYIKGTYSWCSIRLYPSQSVQTSGYVCHDTKLPKAWSNIRRTSGSPWTKFVRTSSCRITGVKHYSKRSIGHGWKKSTKLRMLILCIVSKVYFSRHAWMTLHSLERSKTLILCGRRWMKHVDLGEPTSFLDHVFLGRTQRAWKPDESIVWRVQKDVRIAILCQSNWKVGWLWKIACESDRLV